MIYESYYWKKELYSSFLVLAKFKQLKRPNELSYVKAEKALMIGAYIIRKLDEAQKIPPEILEKKVNEKKKQEKQNFGEIKLTNTVYTYPKSFQHHIAPPKKPQAFAWSFFICDGAKNFLVHASHTTHSTRHSWSGSC